MIKNKIGFTQIYDNATVSRLRDIKDLWMRPATVNEEKENQEQKEQPTMITTPTDTTQEEEQQQQRLASVVMAIPHRRIFFDEFVTGVMAAVLRKPESVMVDVVWVASAPLDVTRNIIVSKFLNSNRDFLFFVDDDVVLPVDVLEALLKTHVHIVSGLYYGRGAPHDPVAVYQGKYVDRAQLATGDLLEVDSVGAGCLLVHRSVFHKLGEQMKWRCMTDHSAMGAPVMSFTYEQAKDTNFLCPFCSEAIFAPFFEHRTGKVDEPPIGSEDYIFCHKARQAGYPVYLNTKVKCGHLTIANITESGLTTGVKRGDATS